VALTIFMVVTGLLSVLPVPTAAAAVPLNACSKTVGTIVAVDFAAWGGPIARGCGVHDPSGYALLHSAGFTTAGDSHDGPALICRLGDAAFDHGTQYPTPAQDACVVTPPASAYWSFWLAPAGQNIWSPSDLGPMSDVPKPGEVEMWVFGDSDTDGASTSGAPSVSPDTLRAHNASPATTTPTPRRTSAGPVTSAPSSAPASRPAAPTARGPAGGQPHSSPAPTAGTASTTGQVLSPATTRTTPRLSPAATERDPSAPATASSPSPSIVAALPDSSGGGTAGSAVPLLVGVGLVALLGSGAAVAARQRRRHGE
jgi:hypothetical protein